MTTIITHELLKSWSPCEDGYERFCELFPAGADLQTAIDGLVADEHDEWAYWLFCKCRDRKLFEELTVKGYMNSGGWNSGDRNSGGWNSGGWNSGDGNSGYFNTDRPSIIRVFGKDCPTVDWERAYKPAFIYFELTYWVSDSEMSDEEKKADPGFHVRGGQLRKRDYKEAFKLSWNNAEKQDRDRVRQLPNFSREMFLEISGIDVDAK